MFHHLFGPACHLRPHRAVLQRLDQFFSDLRDDIWFARFPEIPHGLRKQDIHHGDIRVKHILWHQRATQSLVVHRDGAYLGTLQRDAGRHLVFNAETRAEIDQLIEALDAVARHDAAARSDQTSVSGSHPTPSSCPA